MEIKTGKEIVEWIRGKSLSQLNIEPYNKKWITLDDYRNLINLAREIFEQLELMDYEKKAKETYDEFKEELESFSTFN